MDAVDGHGPRAVHVDHPRSGHLRPLRQGDPHAHVPPEGRTRVHGLHQARPAGPRVPGRHHQGKARLLSDGHARSVRQRRPDHRPDRDGQAVHGSRRPAVLAGKRPRDAVRQHRDAEGHDRPAEAGRPRRRQEQRAGPLRDRTRIRGLIRPEICAASKNRSKSSGFFSSPLGEFVTNWDHLISNSYIWIRHRPVLGCQCFSYNSFIRIVHIYP
ncbi:hypothetical protein EMIT0111MI5_140046 [Burkholderia sp. IT-111MI5]